MEPEPRRLAGSVVRHHDVIPVAERQPLTAADLQRARGRVAHDTHGQTGRPLLDVDEDDVVEHPLEAVTLVRPRELLEGGHRQVAPPPQPDRQAERVGAFERADVAEADLDVPSNERAADLSGAKVGSPARVRPCW